MNTGTKAAIIIVLVALALLSTALIIKTHKNKELYNVGLGIEFNTHATPAWVALHEGYFMKHGVNSTNWYKFETGLQLAAAIAKGDVDVGWVCLAPALKIMDKGVPIKIVAKVHDYGYGLVVNPRKIKSIQDLNGTIVYCVGGKGSPAYLLLLKIEEKYGIKFKEIRFMRPTALVSAIVSGQVDAACLREPGPSLAEYHGFKELLSSRDVWPGMPGSFIVVTTKLLKEEPNAVKAILEANHEGIEFIKKNPEKAAKIVAGYLGIPVDVVKRSISKLEFTEKLDLTEIQEYIDFMYKYGLLKHHLNASEITASTG